MTFSFEMRSGREHNTPDKAMWGFSCTVRAQVNLEIQPLIRSLSTFKVIHQFWKFSGSNFLIGIIFRFLSPL